MGRHDLLRFQHIQRSVERYVTSPPSAKDILRLHERPRPLSPRGRSAGGLTFAVVLVPRVRAVLNAVTDQGVVDAHVAVAKESAGGAGSCGEKEKSR